MKLSAEGKLRLAIRLAFVASVGAAADVAYAQEAQPSDATADAQQLGGVQVIGTRIKQPNLVGTSSSILISDKELKLQGTVNIETLLNNVPQTFAGYSTGDSNGATGTATVDLRGLGPQHTLVLIDGKRLNPGDALQSPPSADLNFIPASLVESIDILSGGASAVYGSDAVAGVVNFRLKHDTNGFHIDSELTRTDHSDATTYKTTLVWGSNFAGGKGNVTVYGGFTNLQALTQDKRTFSAISVQTPTSGNVHLRRGSGTIAEGRFYSYDRAGAGLDGYGIVDPAGTRSLVADDGRTFNFAPFNYLQRPDKRYQLGGFANDKINEHLELYGSAMFLNDRTFAQVAPSGLFFDSATVPCNSSLLSAQEQNFLCTQAGLTPAQSANLLVAKRTVELGPRIADLTHTDYRIVIGGRGDIVKGWSYDVSAQRGEVIQAIGNLNYVNLNHSGAALNTVADPVTGAATCAPGSPAGCVPLDLFQLGAITPAQAAFLRGNGFAQANTVEQIVTGSVTGELGQYGVTSPFAKNGVAVAAGVEYRTEALDYRPDDLTATGQLGGTGGPSPATSGHYQVHEAFSELQVPLIENVPGIKELRLDGAFRWSNYSLANDTQSYKGGIKYAPTSDITFRGSYQRATRAPAVSELFQPQAFGLAGGSDPCAGSNLGSPNSPTQAQCAFTGVTAAQYTSGSIPDCSSGQCNIQTSGNQHLRVEKSKTYSAGVLITPSFIKSLSISVDYFDIGFTDRIGTQPFAAVLNGCLAGDPQLCSQIHRGPTGRLFGGNTAVGNFVTTPNVNTGLARTKGVDFQADYQIRLRDVGLGNTGRVVFNYVATYLLNAKFQSGQGLGVYDCAGLYGTTCGTPYQTYRHKLRATWDIIPIGLSLSANWRYYGSAKLDTNTSDPVLTNGRQDAIDGSIGAKQYLDLSGAYTLPTKDRNVTLRAGISNVGGQNPPILSSNAPNAISSPPFGNANTYPNVYDSLGRVLFVGLSADF